jgi:hypothetical protein
VNVPEQVQQRVRRDLGQSPQPFVRDDDGLARIGA